MRELIRGTAAYKILCGDARSDRLSHAYMLYYNDAACLRDALKIFALAFFGFADGTRGDRLVSSESFADMKIYPAAGKSLSVSDAEDIAAESALRPVEGDKKLFVISGVDTASALFQNKLLKVLEEPPRGVYFLLGAVSLAPVLDTVKSRVKTLELPPFGERDIYGALERAGHDDRNKSAAERCGGLLGVAKSILGGEWYAPVSVAAKKICGVKSMSEAGEISLEYGEFKYKTELLAEMQRLYFAEYALRAEGKKGDIPLTDGALAYALESLDKAAGDIKFNANFAALIYDFAVGVVTENDKWKKL